MKVTQKKLPASQIGLEIEITPETTQRKYEEAIKNLSSTANIPGFRKGKAPRTVLLQRFGSSRIKATILEQMIRDGIEKALKQTDIQIIAEPELSSSFDDLVNKYEPGKPLTISVVVDVQPEVKLAQYTNLSVKAEEIKYDPQQVDQILDKERQEMATLVPVEGRAAQIGDVAIIDYQGVLVGDERENNPTQTKPVSVGQATDYKINLQEDQMIPGFIAGIVGMNRGETQEIAAQFPDNYPNRLLVGKTALFTITLKELKEKELPELNDEFAQEVSEFQSYAELRASLESDYQNSAKERTRANQQEALLQEIIKNLEVELPETFIERELDAIIQEIATKRSQQGVDINKLFTPEYISHLREQSRPDAINRLHRGLALQEIGNRESIQVSEEEVELKLQEVLQRYAQENIDQNKIQLLVRSELLTKKVFDWLLEHSSVELVAEGSLTNQGLAAEISGD